MQKLERWTMFGLVPLVAVLIAARQHYLHITSDLSTWKGGGMGMFAGADIELTRCAKIYLLLGDGERQPLLRLTPEQEELRRQALYHPTEQNFRTLANAIKATTWWSSTDRVPLNVFDENGEKIQDGTGRYYNLYPAHPRAPSEPLNFRVAIEYWKSAYDIDNAKLTSTLARTYSF
jgi:hypothetical protein